MKLDYFKVAAKARLRVQIFLKFCISVVYSLNINKGTTHVQSSRMVGLFNGVAPAHHD